MSGSVSVMTEGTTGAEWAALTIQAFAAGAAAVAAFFAWRTARHAKRDQEREGRLRATEQLKEVQRLLSHYMEVAHRNGDTFRIQMHLRAELAVMTHVKLPNCLALIDPADGDMTLAEFDRLASAAIAEVEQAYAIVWKGEVQEIVGSPRAAATLDATRDETSQDEPG